MSHGRIGDSLKEMGAIDDAFEEFVRTIANQLFGTVAFQIMIETVDLLPHFGGNLFAG